MENESLKKQREVQQAEILPANILNEPGDESYGMRLLHKVFTIFSFNIQIKTKYKKLYYYFGYFNFSISVLLSNRKYLARKI